MVRIYLEILGTHLLSQANLGSDESIYMSLSTMPFSSAWGWEQLGMETDKLVRDQMKDEMVGC